MHGGRSGVEWEVGLALSEGRLASWCWERRGEVGFGGVGEGLAGGVELARERGLDAQQRGQSGAADNHAATETSGGKFAAGHKVIRGRAADTQQLGGFYHAVDEAKITGGHDDLGTRRRPKGDSEREACSPVAARVGPPTIG